MGSQAISQLLDSESFLQRLPRKTWLLFTQGAGGGAADDKIHLPKSWQLHSLVVLPHVHTAQPKPSVYNTTQDAGGGRGGAELDSCEYTLWVGGWKTS